MASSKHGDSTGNFRYRTNWRGKLILQIEVHQVENDRNDYTDHWYTIWRDADVKDLQVIEAKPRLKCE